MIMGTMLLFLLLGTMTSFGLSKPTADTVYNSNSIDDGRSSYLEQYANQMRSFMNLTVPPCDDFYEYACGNWKNTIEERHSERRRVNLGEILYKVDELIESILQRSDIDDVAPEYAAEFLVAKKLYRQCLDTKLYPVRKAPEYLEILRNIGGFPALEPHWNASQFNWLNMSAHLSNYGVEGLVKELITDFYPFKPRYSYPEFGFDVELQSDTIANLSSSEYQQNKKRMHEILALYGLVEEQIEHIISGIVAFLKAILAVDKDKCEEFTSEMDDSQLKVITEQWQAYFDIAWMGKTIRLEGANGPCMFFSHELNRIAEQHNEAMANYLSLKFLYEMDAHLEDPNFQTDYCRIDLKTSLNYFFDHLYMKMYFNKDIAEDVTQMAKEIKQSLRTLLKEADWLDESTREAALLKESAMKMVIGRYEDTEMTKHLLGELKNLKFIEDSYEANRINLQRFKVNMTRYYRLHEELVSDDTKPMVLLTGMEVNLFYYHSDNTLYVMAGVMQPPVYHKFWPNALKYGTLGALLAHEFGHSVDTMGARIDHTGHGNYWWSDKAGAIFDKRAKCFKDFYNNYTIPEINRHINGQRTQNENIADSSGLRMALMTYRRYEKEVIETFDSKSDFYKKEQMPGLDLSPEQLLFVGAAQTWCSSYTVANYWQELTDIHTIDKYRVLGMVTNNEDFAKIYNCPLGSKMNPTTDKCRIF